MAENFIKSMHMKKGALHRQLGVPEGEKIPEGKLKSAEAGNYGPKAEKRAHTAETLKKLAPRAKTHGYGR